MTTTCYVWIRSKNYVPNLWKSSVSWADRNSHEDINNNLPLHWLRYNISFLHYLYNTQFKINLHLKIFIILAATAKQGKHFNEDLDEFDNEFHIKIAGETDEQK